jgi:hypothetical protein
MSSSIRPPGTPPPGPSGLSEVQAQRPDALEASKASARVADPPAQAERSQTPTSVWLSRLSTGEITKQQAIEGLVEQTLSAHGAARLDAAQRSELSEVLRASLLEDPVLRRLLGE